MITYGKVRIRKMCAECNEMFIPTGKTEKLCAQCHAIKLRNRLKNKEEFGGKE